MIICIGEDEYEAEELIVELQFDICKLDAVIEGLVQYRDHKDGTLEWLRSLRGYNEMTNA